ncbi:MAG: hypothetical protein HT580_02695 [Dechloromonas sp.]|nr:MAG: hypothetical protein HT580_02695 [Dechloromonas sp.]
MAHVVARQGSIGIAFVVYPLELRSPGIGLDVAARHVKQRAQDAQRPQPAFRRNSCRTGDAGSAQQIEEQGFRLIALMMTKQQCFRCDAGKRLIARSTSSRFKPEAAVALDRHMRDLA